jgi:hypothetical protein
MPQSPTVLPQVRMFMVALRRTLHEIFSYGFLHLSNLDGTKNMRFKGFNFSQIWPVNNFFFISCIFSIHTDYTVTQYMLNFALRIPSIRIVSFCMLSLYA